MSLQAAVKVWSEKNPEKKIEEEAMVKLICTTPPIDRIDSSLAQFRAVVHLSLSTNCIDKIPPLPALPNLRILSLGRNQIKKISGLDEVGGVLRELWISYNQITALDGLACCVALETLFIANNKIKEIAELKKLGVNGKLANVNFFGNPLAEGASRAETRVLIAANCPGVKIVDGEVIT